MTSDQAIEMIRLLSVAGDGLMLCAGLISSLIFAATWKG